MIFLIFHLTTFSTGRSKIFDFSSKNFSSYNFSHRGETATRLAWFLLETFFGIEKIILDITRNF